MSIKTRNENNRKIVKHMQKITNVYENAQYYELMLTNKFIGMFEYENMPENLDYRELELLLLTNGLAVVFKHKKYGIVCSFCSASGVDIYNNADTATYSQAALGSGTIIDNVNGVLCFNTFLDKKQQRKSIFYTTISRYARMLADIDATFGISLINNRVPVAFTVGNENSAKSVEKMLLDLQVGEVTAIKDSGVMSNVNALDMKIEKGNLTEQMEIRKEIISQFFLEIGVRSRTEKRERLIVDEVNVDDNLLSVNQKNMLDMRKEFVKKINGVLGTEISVKLNRLYVPNFEIDGEHYED